MTLIEEHSAGGEVTGRCDARCYHAKGDDCWCICGGKNHGVGLEQALANVGREEEYDDKVKEEERR